MEEQDNVCVGIFFIREDQWEPFQAMMTDSDSNFKSWQDWKASLDRTKADLMSEGVNAVDVEVNLEEFRNWCESREAELDGQARAQYASEILRDEGT